jgi:hypothetical protein
MQQEERDLIADLFGRLKSFEAQPRDPEAERLIGGAIASQPGAPYLLVQTVLVQEQALKAAQDRIAQLEAKAAAAPAPGFLASAPKIGPWGTASVPSTAPQPQPLQQPLQQAPAAFAPQMAAGGGFLRQALTTAAGVAGGALLFDGIRSMLGHNPGPFGAVSTPDTYGAVSTPGTDVASSLMPPDRYSPADLPQDDSQVDDSDQSSADDQFAADPDDSGGSAFDNSDDV